MRDFFISYNRHDVAWAEWIAWQLVASGYEVYVQAWDFAPGHNFVEKMDEATKNSRRTLALLSEDYLKSGFTAPEWQAAFVQDPKSQDRKMIPIRVRDCHPEGLLAAIVYADLVGLDEAQAREKLLQSVKMERRVPVTPPLFPNAAPAFPSAAETPEGTIQNYLTQKLEADLEEVGYKNFVRRLEKAFVSPSADVRQYTGRKIPDLDPELYDDEFVSDLHIEIPGELHPPREEFSGEAEFAPNICQRIQELIRVVLLGEPGAGKTFLLARLALDYRNNYLKNPSEPLPLFIPLSKYDTTDDFETFCAKRLGNFAPFLPPLQTTGNASSPLETVWLLDALNEMPRDKGQWEHLKAFMGKLTSANIRFVLTCRVKNYEENLGDIRQLYRVDLQDLNPQQIYDILAHYLKPITEGTTSSPSLFVDTVWKDVMHGEGLLEAWQAWKGSLRDFWACPERYVWKTHERARKAIHDEPRKLLLLCRNPFTLVRLLIPRIQKAVSESRTQAQLLPLLAQVLPNNRANLFKLVIQDMLNAEAKRHSWQAGEVEQVTRTLERLAAALQETEQRTEMEVASLHIRPDWQPEDEERLRKGCDAGLVTVGETGVRFNHQLFQEYFATRRLQELLADYDQRYPHWECGAALPPRDTELATLFPDWWDVGGWGVTVTLLGEMVGKPGISRVVRWLASYAPEIALRTVLDNNDGVGVEDITDKAREALIEGAKNRCTEQNPIGRAAAYRVLGHPKIDADTRRGVGVGTNGLPDIERVTIPDKGEWLYQRKPHPALPAFEISRYPITYAQFQTFLDDAEGYANAERWFEGLAADATYREMREQEFKYGNHPRETVNWYQAVAFCRWLSWRMGGGYALEDVSSWRVRLPTEQEWEKAASRGIGLEYPYGNEFDANKGNVNATGIGQTSAVGLFPDDNYPNGVLDMSGNVWEWCLTNYKSPARAARKENLRTSSSRVCRGGSWGYGGSLARAGARNGRNPSSRGLNLGFRVVFLP